MVIESEGSARGPMEEPYTQTITSYKEFLRDKEAEPGQIISGVKANDLFTYQNFTDDEKIANIYNYFISNDPRLHLISGYLHFHTKFQENVIVIGNGNHRALFALHSGKTVDVLLQEPLQHEQNPFRITNLVRMYGDVFASFE